MSGEGQTCNERRSRQTDPGSVQAVAGAGSCTGQAPPAEVPWPAHHLPESTPLPEGRRFPLVVRRDMDCRMIKYIGSKRVLVPTIVAAVGALPDVHTVLDVFSGTARVGHALK